MSWTWIALLIEILGVIAVFVLVFLIARSLIRYANSLKKERRQQKTKKSLQFVKRYQAYHLQKRQKESLFMIYKNVTR